MGQKRRTQPERLPSKLREIRLRLGLSMDQLAERMKHVPSPPTSGQISRFEQGKREPSLLVLLEYSRITRVRLEVLVDDNLDLPEL
jgi:transcriptional regulator with XRE-family HTH domain